MSNRYHTITIKDAMNTWAESAEPGENHVPMNRLYQFSLKKGFQSAKPSELKHLSLCPRCMDDLKILYDFEQPETHDNGDIFTTDPTLGFGCLQAAGSGIHAPLQLKSDCQHYLLSILPEDNQPQNAMIVLEVLSGQDTSHGKLATIKDSQSNLVMASTVRHGRAAAKTDQLNNFDFSTWSIVLSEPSSKGQ